MVMVNIANLKMAARMRWQKGKMLTGGADARESRQAGRHRQRRLLKVD